MRKLKPETALRRALTRLVLAVDDYAGAQFFAKDNGMGESREAKRLDAARHHACVILEIVAPPKRANPSHAQGLKSDGPEA